MHYHFTVVLFLAAVIQLVLDITIRKQTRRYQTRMVLSRIDGSS